MVTTQDCSIGLVNESTYGTYVAPTRFLEFTSESLDWKPEVRQGAGLRVGGRVARSGRRVRTMYQGEGDIEVEATTKGLGLVWESLLGTGTSTLVSGSTYQQVFTLGDTLPSRTIQKGIVQADGTVRAHSFLGCVASSWELTADQGEIAVLKTSWDIRDLDTAQSYAAPSYPSTPSLFHFVQGAITYGGAVTVPTSTALAVAGTAAGNIRSITVSGDNKLTTDRFNFGAAGKKAKPTVGLREIGGKFTAEFDSTTYRDNFIADTAAAIVLTFTSAEALSTGFATLQVVLPAAYLENGVPQANSGDLVTVDYDFTVLDNLVAAQPIYVVHRTADTAL